ncbi:MAG: ribonuclease HIII [Bacteroidetes bacterium]|nr:ribonuclease HIII [Bacteroidota bacterium]
MTAQQKAEQLLDEITMRCTGAGLPVGETTHKQWNVEAAVGEGPGAVKVLVYFNAKGSLTPKIQGKASPLRELVEMQLHGDEPLKSAFLHAEVHAWIGVDESGKGDYFGPITAAGVLVTDETLAQLRPLVLRDSKELVAARINSAAAEIRRICEGSYAIVTVMPEKYNEFMAGTSFGKNSQRILAWMHARCIEDLLEKHENVKHAICDKFADDAVIRRALQTRGRGITVHQHVRAEADPAVAAASILARWEFTRRIAQLEDAAGCRLPLGASDERGILEATRHILGREGAGGLKKYAKLHFKTTEKIRGRM